MGRGLTIQNNCDLYPTTVSESFPMQAFPHPILSEAIRRGGGGNGNITSQRNDWLFQPISHNSDIMREESNNQHHTLSFSQTHPKNHIKPPPSSFPKHRTSFITSLVKRNTHISNSQYPSSPAQETSQSPPDSIHTPC